MSEIWTAERVKALRERLGLNQSYFASRLGCGQATVSMWESGERQPAGLYAAALDRLAADSDRAPGMDARQFATIIKEGKIHRLMQAVTSHPGIIVAETWDIRGWAIHQVPGARLFAHYRELDAAADRRRVLTLELRKVQKMQADDYALAERDADRLGSFYRARAERWSANIAEIEAELAALPPEPPPQMPIEMVLCVNADEQPHNDPYRAMVDKDTTIVLYRKDWLAGSDIPVQPGEVPF